MNKSYLIKAKEEVHTMDFSGPIGQLFTECGLEPCMEYDVEYTVDGYDIDIVEIRDSKTDEVIWNNLDRTLRWNDNDDEIWEASAYAVEFMTERESLV